MVSSIRHFVLLLVWIDIKVQFFVSWRGKPVLNFVNCCVPFLTEFGSICTRCERSIRKWIENSLLTLINAFWFHLLYQMLIWLMLIFFIIVSASESIFSSLKKTQFMNWDKLLSFRSHFFQFLIQFLMNLDQVIFWNFITLQNFIKLFFMFKIIWVFPTFLTSID